MMTDMLGRWTLRRTDDPTIVSGGTRQLDPRLWPYVVDMPYPPFALGRTGAAIAAHPDGPEATLRYARLIAAANQLLAACEAAEVYLLALELQNPGYQSHADMRQRLREAILAAGGDALPSSVEQWAREWVRRR